METNPQEEASSHSMLPRCAPLSLGPNITHESRASVTAAPQPHPVTLPTLPSAATTPISHISYSYLFTADMSAHKDAVCVPWSTQVPGMVPAKSRCWCGFVKCCLLKCHHVFWGCSSTESGSAPPGFTGGGDGHIAPVHASLFALTGLRDVHS